MFTRLAVRTRIIHFGQRRHIIYSLHIICVAAFQYHTRRRAIRQKLLDVQFKLRLKLELFDGRMTDKKDPICKIFWEKECEKMMTMKIQTTTT